MQRNIYRSINSFGPSTTSDSTNPLTYCLNDNIDQRFLHGGNSDMYGQNSRPCQAFLSDYCAEHWDDFCEVASKNNTTSYPNNMGSCSSNNLANTAGDVLVRNTAAKKYLVAMGNCIQKFEPFDPTVADSPMISYWVPDCYNYTYSCSPLYAVDPKTIDDDIVMNKVLSKPYIAIDILANIFNTMSMKGTISQLKGTKLGKFFDENLSYFQGKM
jgi:hypothetical protein